MLRSVYRLTKAFDATRPVIDTSGFFHVVTDLYDLHDYEQYPQVFQAHHGTIPPPEAPAMTKSLPASTTAAGNPCS